MFDLQDNEKMLIVAPHPDDETLGCGGLMLKYGNKCDVLLLTDGRKGKSEKRKTCSDEDIISIRKNELRKALDIAGVDNLFCLDIPDSSLHQSKKKVNKFDASAYKFIFIPNKYETHLDHKAANKFFKSMRFWGRTKAKVYEYEVWTPLRAFDVLIDISDVVKEKEKMIKQFESQLECKNYLNAGMGLSYYRGISCDSTAAEVFYRSDASVTDKLKRFISNIINTGEYICGQ